VTSQLLSEEGKVGVAALQDLWNALAGL